MESILQNFQLFLAAVNASPEFMDLMYRLNEQYESLGSSSHFVQYPISDSDDDDDGPTNYESDNVDQDNPHDCESPASWTSGIAQGTSFQYYEAENGNENSDSDGNSSVNSSSTDNDTQSAMTPSEE